MDKRSVIISHPAAKSDNARGLLEPERNLKVKGCILILVRAYPCQATVVPPG